MIFFQISKYKKEIFNLNFGLYTDDVWDLNNFFVRKLINNICPLYSNIDNYEDDIYNFINNDKEIDNKLKNIIIEYYKNYYNKLNLIISCNFYKY